MTIQRSKRLLLIAAVLSLAALACNATGAPPTLTPTPRFTPYIAPTFTPVYASSTPIPVNVNPTPIPVALQPTAVPAGTSATRIRFAPGTTSTTLANRPLYSGIPDSFVLNVEAGQIMTVELSTPLSINVVGPTGAAVAPAANSGTFWSGRLPIAGDYILNVATPGAAVSYTLTIAIPLRDHLRVGWNLGHRDG